MADLDQVGSALNIEWVLVPFPEDEGGKNLREYQVWRRRERAAISRIGGMRRMTAQSAIRAFPDLL